MNRTDLAQLDRFLSTAAAVVPMRDIALGNNDPRVIGLRHDVDDNRFSLDTALRMAAWEQERGYRSTYFLLHDTSYWFEARAAARELCDMGHEVGLHNNAIAEGIRQRRSPFDVLSDALHYLRRAVNVTGTVAHGDELCRTNGLVRFVNDEMWMECRRTDMGAADRRVDGVRLEQRSLWDYGLKYEANWLRRGDYVSDSGNRWNPSPTALIEAALAWPSKGQLHLLVHPDWWANAFDGTLVAA